MIVLANRGLGEDRGKWRYRVAFFSDRQIPAGWEVCQGHALAL